MYSPKIDPRLIPVLYRVARARHLPMTKLVDQLLEHALRTDPHVPPAALERLEADIKAKAILGPAV